MKLGNIEVKDITDKRNDNSFRGMFVTITTNFVKFLLLGNANIIYIFLFLFLFKTKDGKIEGEGVYHSNQTASINASFIPVFR